MYQSQMSDKQLVMRWIPVADRSGRTRMESCWVSLSQAAPAEVSLQARTTHAA